MNAINNCVDDLASILLRGEMSQNRSAAVNLAKQKLKELSDINISGKQGRTLLIHCCAYGYYDLAQFAVDNGADVNLQDKDGFSPLHVAVKMGNCDLVELLLKKGASPNAKNRFGNTPAFDASGKWEILKLLLDYGCDVYCKNFSNVSAYDMILLHPDTLEHFQEYYSK